MTTAFAPSGRRAADPLRGRLPGIVCDPSPAAAGEEAIRMDVAAFVGLAQRGPVDIAVPVEDPEQYVAVFGGDLPLAVDDSGQQVWAALPDAVRSFFANGGQRAHVVRVAGEDAVTVGVPVRVSSRIPLGAGMAVIDLEADTVPLRSLPAASPGGWAVGVTVDVAVLDTVLALTTTREGHTELSPASRALLDEGDAVLVLRASGAWEPLTVPAERPGRGLPSTEASVPLVPPGGWRDDDVARLLRLDLTVQVADEDGVRAVERFSGLRLGRGGGRSLAWSDVLQPSGTGFRPDRSMYLRAPDSADMATLVPVLGPVGQPVPPPPARAVPSPASRAALAFDGLVSFDPVRLFLDPALAGTTVESLRSALELLGLDDEPRARGLHAVALVPEVTILALPDLYQRPWTEQTVPTERSAVDPPVASVAEPVGFSPCGPAPAQPPPPAPGPSRPPAELRMVLDPSSRYDPAALHEVAGAAADLCAARADLVAVLALPRHAGAADARAMADVLAARRAATADVPSYVGIWHPWGAVATGGSGGPSLSTPARLRPVPPDGAVVGTIAATELSVGWWVEPAGRPLVGFVDADLFDHATTLDLFTRGLNVIRRRPAGLAATSAHTLSADRSLLQFSVRRLLVYVRLLAQREGTRYVFEPDDERFRDQVAATFVRLLEVLRVEGALAAYAVEIESLRTRTTADEGTLRVDLKLAPTSPLEFITVSLLRSGDGALQVRSA